MRTLQAFFLSFILIAAAVNGVHASSLPGLKSEKSSKNASGEVKEAPKPAETPAAKHPDIDARQKSLQESLAGAQRLLASVRAEITTSAMNLFGATPEEYERRGQQARALVYEYERHIEALNRQRKVRDERPDPSSEPEQLAIFLRQAPYTIDQVDELRGQILDAKARIGAVTMRRSMSESELERTKQELKDAGVKLRQLQEKLDAAKSKIEENRLSWQRDQAQLAEQLARAKLNTLETSLSVSEMDLENQKAGVALLERKLAIAVANAPFTREALEAKREKLNEELRKLQQEQDKAGVARDAATKKLEEAREAVRQAREKLATLPAPALPGINAGAGTSSRTAATVATTAAPTTAAALVKVGPPAPGEKNPAAEASEKQLKKIAELQAVADLRKDESDAAGAVYSMYRSLVYYADFEQNVWETRFRDTNPSNPEQYNEIQSLITAGMEKIAQGKVLFQSNMDLANSQMVLLQGKLEQWKPEDGDMKSLRQRIAAQQTRSDCYRRCMDQVRKTERLLQSWQTEVTERMSHLTLKQRMEAWQTKTLAFLKTIWDFEVLSAQDTVIVDGRQITKQRSVTVGKLVSAILILTLGSWICHRVANAVRWTVRRRLRIRDQHARLLYKSIFTCGLVLVVLVTMTTLRIPLTIFAFLGGALAIGIGFGAQNLINNFISGMILIFERPIKLGDIVEVDGLKGQVVGIGGRCSCIKRFDGIDILVPNSSFLEKSVINWTHSDLLLRLKVQVGVAYGSPAREAAKLIARAVEEHGQILKDPAPVVVFEDFGDNALIFTAYFWIEQRQGIDSRVVASDVRYRIDKLFREAEISIAYPQRDIHIDAVKPIQVSLTNGNERVGAAEREL